MKKVSCFAVCVFLSFLWIPLVSAAPNNGPAAQNQTGQVQDSQQGGQVIKPKAGISWKEKVLKQREIQKKAAARRNILMQQAEKERQKNATPPVKNP